MRTRDTQHCISIRMEGTSVKPTPQDRKQIEQSVEVLSKESKKCGGDVFLRHDKRRRYKVLEVVCQCPVRLIEDG